MAEIPKKVSELDKIENISDDDLFFVSDKDGESCTSKKMELKQLTQYIVPLFMQDNALSATICQIASTTAKNAADEELEQLSDALKLKLGVKKQETEPYIAVELPDCAAEGDNSIAVGSATSALSKFSFAEGLETIAEGKCSHAAGESSHTYGDYSNAEGWESYAYGKYSHSEGDYTKAYGQAVHTEGYDTSAVGYAAHAEGTQTIAFGESSHAEGQSTQSMSYCSHAEGVYTSAGKCSHAEGACTMADTVHGHAEGCATAAGSTVKIGQLKVVSCLTNPSGHEYNGTEAVDSFYSSISVRWRLSFDTASGSAGKKIADLISADSIEFGYEGPSTENYVVPVEICENAAGYKLTAYNFTKVPGSMMWDNKILLSVSNNGYASYINCFADKNSNSTVNSYFSDASPTQTKAAAVYALNTQLPTGEYLDNSIYARYAHAEGCGTEAVGKASHSEGERTRAFGSVSHAEGYDTTAVGRGSRVNGVHSFAEGKFSTAIGKCVNSKAEYSIAAGMCCTAEHARSFVWSGPYVGHNTTNYKSKGSGTFCINPDAGLSGFWIGDKNFISSVADAASLMDDSQKSSVKDCMFAQQISADSTLTSFYDIAVNHPEQTLDIAAVASAVCKLMNILGYNA